METNVSESKLVCDKTIVGSINMGWLLKTIEEARKEQSDILPGLLLVSKEIYETRIVKTWRIEES